MNPKTKITKAKLLQAVRLIIAMGEKPSVTAITKKAKLAYGTFYRYFRDLDEIYFAAIEDLLFDLAEVLERDLEKIYVQTNKIMGIEMATITHSSGSPRRQ